MAESPDVRIQPPGHLHDPPGAGADAKAMTPDELTLSLAALIRQRKRVDRPVIVGINGVDGSGKTTLAVNTAQTLRAMGVPVSRISVDDFLHPREHRYRRGRDSPRGYYEDSVNYEALVAFTLKPASFAEGVPRNFKTKHFDLLANKEVSDFQELSERSYLLVEGIFLFHPVVVPYFHLMIFVHADFHVILDRVAARDRRLFGSEDAVRSQYESRYIPGQQLYLKEIKPKDLADVVVENNDYDQPIVTFR